MTHRSAMMTLIACAVAVGCSDEPLDPCPPAQAALTATYSVIPPLPTTRFDAHFAAAARSYDVDAALLKAIAWTETRFHHVVPEHPDETIDHHGQPPAWGVMALRGERLERAAALAGLDVEIVRRSVAANIAAAAALLAAEARAAGVFDLPAEQWGPALERYAGIDLPAGRGAYVQAVLPALRAAQPQADRGEAAGGMSSCTKLPPVQPRDLVVWRASPNFNQRASGVAGQVAMIIVHTCEGAYVGCWSWLTNTASQVSAHYVVNEDGTEISRLVDEPGRAWHIGATYDCLLNRSRRCDLSGVQSNHFTVGIEHAGFASQTSFPSQQIDVSAQLTCEITRRHNIPRDYQHIVAHGQLQPYNRTDPGPNWPWVRYITLTQRHCGEIVVDDDAAFNDASFARVAAPATWSTAATTPGYYAGGYRFAPTSAGSDDPLVFEFQLERAGEHTIETRWAAGSNRSSAVRFTLKSGDAVRATVQLDQRTGHDEWHAIAKLPLPAGWHRVEVSRRGSEGSVVIADAVRVR